MPARSKRPTRPPYTTLQWVGDVHGHLRLLDQTRLPHEVAYIDCENAVAVVQAIRTLQVRGAPAIGIAAAYGVVLGVRESADDPQRWRKRLADVTQQLADSRPTAVNLFWALDRMNQCAARLPDELPGEDRMRALLEEAQRIGQQDRTVCRQIGRHGRDILRHGTAVLTHCNAGGLATSEYGTALSVIFTAHDQGKDLHVFVDETRPLLQGARLTTWELQQFGVPHTLICDSAAAHLMQRGLIDVVITGADRIAANGDTANKIGTYAIALAAAAHDIPFFVAAPASTFDLSIASGEEIPIEERDAAEVTQCFGRPIAPAGTPAANPAFDVTPARYIRGIVTEHGLIRPVSADTIEDTLRARRG